jgi:hypothetical protein
MGKTIAFSVGSKEVLAFPETFSLYSPSHAQVSD